MNDEQIIIELKKNNTEIFRELINTYQNKIFSMTYKFTNDYMESQDLSQDIFLKIYLQIKKFKGNSKLSTWIYKIAINTCLDWKKKKTKFKILEFQSLTEQNSVATIDDDGYIEQKILFKENQKLLHNIIFNLPDIYKTVIILYHFNSLSYSEISSILKIPEKTVETRLYRGRKKFKDCLLQYEIGGNKIEM